MSWFHNIPVEFVPIWSPLLRTMFTVQMLYKSRAPDAPPINMITDEAGQLGNFEALLRSFTFGRGAGVRAWALFQDAGQIVRNFGAPALQGFIGSAAMRQFFGVRDYQTAQMVSEMLGTETLEYDDTLRQADARRQKMHAAIRVMNGDDPFAAYGDLKYNAFAESHRTKQARALMTSDEILSMREDQQILFVAGKNLKPVMAEKLPYFSRPDLVGRFLPNPFHGPQDRIEVPGRWGKRTLRIIREAVPPEFQHLPQYCSTGTWAFVEGHRPT